MHEDHTDIIETHDGDRQAQEARESARSTEVYTSTPHSERVTEVSSTSAPRMDVPRTNVDRYETVAYDPFDGRRIAAYRITQLIYWVFALVEGLIAVRLILKVLGANPAAGFAQFLYGITTPLVAPFLGLFGNPVYQNSVLELSSIVALIVYALIAWLLGKLVWILVGEHRSAVRTRSTQMDSRI
jgi:hypothetical protein